MKAAYFFEQLLQLLVLVRLHKDMLVVNVLDDECMAMVFIDFYDDGLDGWIALDQDAFTIA